MEPSDLITSPVWQSLPGNIYYQDTTQTHYGTCDNACALTEAKIFGIGIVVAVLTVLLLAVLTKILDR